LCHMYSCNLTPHERDDLNGPKKELLLSVLHAVAC